MIVRPRRLDAFVAVLRQAVLPWFAEASDPATAIASLAGDRTSRPAALVEWCVSRGRPDLPAAHLNRRLTRSYTRIGGMVSSP